MKLADRMKIARECGAIATAHGASVEILPRGIGGERETLVTLKWPELSASFDVGDGGVLVSFFDAKRALADHLIFDSVNPCHRRKATTSWNDGCGPVFLRWLAAASAVIANGEVFAP